VNIDTIGDSQGVEGNRKSAINAAAMKKSKNGGGESALSVSVGEERFKKTKKRDGWRLTKIGILCAGKRARGGGDFCLGRRLRTQKKTASKALRLDGGGEKGERYVSSRMYERAGKESRGKVVARP